VYLNTPTCDIAHPFLPGREQESPPDGEGLPQASPYLFLDSNGKSRVHVARRPRFSYEHDPGIETGEISSLTQPLVPGMLGVSSIAYRHRFYIPLSLRLVKYKMPPKKKEEPEEVPILGRFRSHLKVSFDVDGGRLLAKYLHVSGQTAW